MSKHTDNEAIMADLRSVKDKLGIVPSHFLYREHGEFHPNTVVAHFGKWNNALIATFGELCPRKAGKHKRIRPLIPCEHCGTLTVNAHFCTKKCANVCWGLRRTRPPSAFNCDCGARTCHEDSVCMKCRRIEDVAEYGKRVIGEFVSEHARHKYQKIRAHAHRVSELNNLNENCFCGYLNHSELSHIKSIGSFPKTTPLSIVNHIENLVWLCPNHHWELDNGVLKLERTAGIPPA